MGAAPDAGVQHVMPGPGEVTPRGHPVLPQAGMGEGEGVDARARDTGRDLEPPALAKPATLCASPGGQGASCTAMPVVLASLQSTALLHGRWK